MENDKPTLDFYLRRFSDGLKPLISLFSSLEIQLKAKQHNHQTKKIRQTIALNNLASLTSRINMPHLAGFYQNPGSSLLLPARFEPYHFDFY